MAEKRQPSCLAVDRNALATSTSNFDNLPEEVVAEIMSWLPPESLRVCKCLNKSWCFFIRCLIKDPKFVAKHFHHARASPATLLVYECYRPQKELMTTLVTNTTSSSDDGFKDDIHLAIENFTLWDDLPHHWYDIYHCDGIICLAESSKAIRLCNLAMREFCMLNPETYLDLKEYRILGSGFGKDLRHGNYKIVRLLKPMKAEVFTLGTTNSWREIGICVNENQYDDLEEHVYLKGKCFWLMSFSDPWAVLCFDLCTEIFHTIALPSLTGMEICGTLSVRDDSLCFFWYPPETASGNCIHMWELDFNDDGVGIEDFTYSWRKCLETEPFERFYVPLTFWQSDELLLKRESYSPEGDRILSYNIPTRRLRKVKLPVYGKLGSIYYRGPYVKSLVSIKENKLA